LLVLYSNFIGVKWEKEALLSRECGRGYRVLTVGSTV
jgi:hypothetical protein